MPACPRRLSPLVMTLTGLTAIPAMAADRSPPGPAAQRCPDGPAIIEARNDNGFVITCKSPPHLPTAARHASPSPTPVGAATLFDNALLAQTPFPAGGAGSNGDGHAPRR
ncbi:hypothetical protein BV97_05129 [Novosphingobium resinovorum]|uniref:Uncharacterized protein n=1 Tax=Novosphingobium resinovorum TaxID=158500 RepID=A0A031JG93_9SPHN|nr:hypothetical protein BV97_05129 [Novosphingobium resinovorum]